MWAAVVLVCHLSMEEVFKYNLNENIVIPDRKCYMSISPKVHDTQKKCLLTVKEAMDNPNFTREPGFSIFSFECFEWDNPHFVGEPI